MSRFSRYIEKSIGKVIGGENMKILVDNLPYDKSSCPFNFADSWGYSLCPCRNNEEKCPMYWNLSKIFSDDNPRQCEWFIEYYKFMELRKENN